jgi:hypothetical protein
MREAHKKGTLRFSMQSLIGDSFLKRFFGSRSHRRRANPDGEAGKPTANEGEKLLEPGYLPGEDPLEKVALLEMKNTGELTKHFDPQNGSKQPLASDDQKEWVNDGKVSGIRIGRRGSARRVAGRRFARPVRSRLPAGSAGGDLIGAVNAAGLAFWGTNQAGITALEQAYQRCRKGI